MKKKVLVLIANGNEETELICTVDILRRAQIEVVMASVVGQKQIISAHGIKIEADALLKDIQLSDFQMLILPGGLEGSRTFQNDAKVQEIIKEFYNQRKYLGAICAAPIALGKAGILQDKKAVCYPGFEHELNSKKTENQPFIIDDNIITAQGVAYTIDFALNIVQILCGKSVRDKVAEQILYKY